MVKKRKAWWIVGAFVLAVAFAVDFNSTDAKVERALAQLIDEYGFDLQTETLIDTPRSLGDTKILNSRAPMDAGTADEIVLILLDATPSWEHTEEIASELVDESYEIHFFRRTEQDDSMSAVLWIFFDEDLVTVDKGPTAQLYLTTYDRPSLLERIKALWPW